MNLQDLDKEVIGKNIIERESGYVDRYMNKDSKENRGLYINFLKSRELVAVNTFFDKPNFKRVTYKEKVQIDETIDSRNKPPYNYTKYAQCDYIMTNKNTMNKIADCESDIHCPIQSDHFPVYLYLIKKKNPR